MSTLQSSNSNIFETILNHAYDLVNYPLEEQTEALEKVFVLVGSDVLSSDIYTSRGVSDEINCAILSDYLQWVNQQFDVFSGEFHSSHVEFAKMLYRFFATICLAGDMSEPMTQSEWNVIVNELNKNWINRNDRSAQYGPICSYMLGLYYKEMASFDESALQLSIESFEKCIHNYPRLIGAYLKLLEVQETLGLYQENVQLATKALSVLSDSNMETMKSTILKHRALAYFKLGEKEQGMKDYESAHKAAEQGTPTKERFEQKLESYVLKSATV